MSPDNTSMEYNQPGKRNAPISAAHSHAVEDERQSPVGSDQRGLRVKGSDMDYRQLLEESYLDESSRDRTVSRLAYLSEYIFDFTTYDSAMAELFAVKAVEVCEAISEGTTFTYIEDPARYRWYIVMVNMPFFADKLDWGTSIRGAWWAEQPHGKIKFQSDGLFLDNEQLSEPMEFTREEWERFIAAIRGFAASAQVTKG